jgi:hypothetical protein
MGALLAEFRTRLRDDLDDSAGDVWTDDELDRHISHALRELSHYLPRQRKTTLATIADDRELDVSSLTPRRRIEAVEYPTGNDPKTSASFTLWMDTLTIVSGSVPDGSNANLYWTGQHTLDLTTTTLSEEDEEILALGAEGYACRQQAYYQINRLATGGPSVDRDWSSEYKELLRQFHAALRSRRAVTRRHLYSSVEPTPTQDTDPGPGAP